MDEEIEAQRSQTWPESGTWQGTGQGFESVLPAPVLLAAHCCIVNKAELCSPWSLHHEMIHSQLHQAPVQAACGPPTAQGRGQWNSKLPRGPRGFAGALHPAEVRGD